MYKLSDVPMNACLHESVIRSPSIDKVFVCFVVSTESMGAYTSSD